MNEEKQFEPEPVDQLFEGLREFQDDLDGLALTVQGFQNMDETSEKSPEEMREEIKDSFLKVCASGKKAMPLYNDYVYAYIRWALCLCARVGLFYPCPPFIFEDMDRLHRSIFDNQVENNAGSE